MTVTVDDAGLRGLTRTARRAADEVGDARGRLPGGGLDLGYVSEVHASVVTRWSGGLRVAEAAADEVGDKIEACRVEYAAVEDDTTVTFSGLDR